VLDITGGAVTISDLVITQRFSSGVFGGGIVNSGTLTLTNCTVDYKVGHCRGRPRQPGTASVTNYTFNLDSAGEVGDILSGGIISGPLSLSGTNISNCTAIGNGGGMFNDGALTLTTAPWPTTPPPPTRRAAASTTTPAYPEAVRYHRHRGYRR
jgi:hypothetical protein